MDLTAVGETIALAQRQLGEYEAARRASADRPPSPALRLVVELEDGPAETSRWEIRLEGGPDWVIWGAIGHVDRQVPPDLLDLEAAFRCMVQLVEDHAFARKATR